MPTFYKCQRCTACCRWPGQVKLTDEEVSQMSSHLELSEHEFIQEYTRVRADRRGLSLKDKPNGECILLEESKCRVQPVKPQQCRDFPNLWNFPGFQKDCDAIAIPVDGEEYRKRVKEATGRHPPESFGG
ncbi:MAG: zinc/iron-chelating domain-containing protein [Verrucomicrobiales bacterium]|nr:zinc/iron-chelating domain-containing protein [Verrucomicrobiales bacterium]